MKKIAIMLAVSLFVVPFSFADSEEDKDISAQTESTDTVSDESTDSSEAGE